MPSPDVIPFALGAASVHTEKKIFTGNHPAFFCNTVRPLMQAGHFEKSSCKMS